MHTKIFALTTNAILITYYTRTDNPGCGGRTFLYHCRVCTMVHLVLSLVLSLRANGRGFVIIIVWYNKLRNIITRINN